MAKKRVAVLLTERIHYKIKYIAKNEGRTMSQQIRYIIRIAVEDYEKENGYINIET